ncbi:MAG: hypothetical protein IJS67_02165 [Clostridia bacterium]|nr:hypothetical protein [Clostridia bacterium]
MYYYLLCATPCAVKLNGEYIGKASENYSIIDADAGLMEIIPLCDGYHSVNFLIGKDCEESQNMKIIDLSGGFLLIPVFKRTIFSDFKMIKREVVPFSYGEVAVTCYAENGVRLIAENKSDLEVESIPFYPDDATFFKCGGKGGEYLIVLLTGKRTMVTAYKIDKKIQMVFRQTCDAYSLKNNILTLTERKNDVLKHVVTTDWEFAAGVKAVRRTVVRKKPLYALPERLVSYAFFEEIALGGDLSDFLTARLRPRAKEMKGFLGRYTAVLPPPHFKPDNLVMLLYEKEVRYAETKFSGGLIDNLTLLDKDEI